MGRYFYGVDRYTRRKVSITRRSAAAVFQRRVVQCDAHFVCVVSHVAPGLVHGCDFAVFAGEAHFAHAGRAVASDENAGIGDFTLSPAFEGKARVFGVRSIAANKIGQRASPGCAEGLRIDRQGGFEQHGAHLVAVGGVDHFFRQRFSSGLAAGGVYLADVDQGLAPRLLCCLYFGGTDFRMSGEPARIL